MKDEEKSFILGHSHTRTVSLSTKVVDEEARTVDLAFSSQEPYERYWGVEILDHGPGAVRMQRLTNGAALLVNHDADQHVGVVEQARIDQDGFGRATVRFGRGAQATEVFGDVLDGIRTKVSVGYEIHDMELERREEGAETFRVTDWEPFEISLAAVPADDTVGVGRTAEATSHTQRKAEMPDEILEAHADEPREDNGPGTSERYQDSEIITEVINIDAGREAIDAQIRGLADKVKRSVPNAAEIADEVIAIGGSVSDMQAQLRSVYNARVPRAVPATPRDEPSRIEMTYPRRSKKLRAFENTRRGEEAAYRSGMWAMAAIYGSRKATQWCKDYGVRVMTGTTSTTSSVVPDEMVLPIIDLREEYGVARQWCFVHPMSSDTATVPRRKSGVTAYFPGRDEDTTASDAAFDDVQLVAREVSALTKLSKAYVEDSAIDLGDHLASEMAYAFSVKEDDCLINGDGTSSFGGIYGIRPKIIDGTHTVGAVDAGSGLDTFAELTAADLDNCAGALPEFPGINPIWVASKKGWNLSIKRLQQAAGGNTTITLGEATPKQWDGDQVVISQAMPKVATDLSNVAMLVYGDLMMGVTFGDRMGIEVDVLRERYAEKRQIGVIATERFDIVVHGLGDTSSAGPIVALIGE